MLLAIAPIYLGRGIHRDTRRARCKIRRQLKKGKEIIESGKSPEAFGDVNFVFGGDECFAREHGNAIKTAGKCVPRMNALNPD